ERQRSASHLHILPYSVSLVSAKSGGFPPSKVVSRECEKVWATPMSLHTLGQMHRDGRLFSQSAFRYGHFSKIHPQEHPTQAPTRRTATPIPKACGHRRCRGGYVCQDIARQPSQLWETVTALPPKHKRPVRAEHLFGRQREPLDRPAVAVQTPQCTGGYRQVRRHHQRFLVARIVDHRTPKRRGARPSGGEDQIVPDMGAYYSSSHHPLSGGIWRRSSNRLALVCAGQG